MRIWSISTMLLLILMSSRISHAASYRQEVMADNPFVYYPFDESEGSQAADASGNNFHGEYVDGVELGKPGAGPGTGNSALFDGESGYVQVPILDLESDQVTIETWINLELLAGGCCTSIFSPDGWQPGWLHYNLKNDANIEFALNSGGPNNHNTDPDTVPFEEWVHIASVYDKDEAEVRTYFNGEDIDVFPPDFASPQTVNLIVDAQIAAWQNTRFLGGGLDEFAIYASALSEERIKAHVDAATAAALPGDFDGNGALDADDVNELIWKIAGGMNESAFDLTGDGTVDDADLRVWVKDLKNTWFGDANLDGEFNSTDFVDIFQTGKFELDEEANWSQGDWTGDHRFNSSDFVVAFQDGGYELGPAPGPAAVPEPASIMLFVVGLMVLATRASRRQS